MRSLALLVARTFSDAWAIWLLWRWFVLPLGAPPLSYWHAIGIDLFVGLFFLFGATKMEEDEEKRFTLLVGKLIATPVVVGMGWLALKAMQAA